VQTEDGYLLTLFRIPGRKGDKSSKPPVFFQHGILDSADGWVVHKRDKSPAFVAADAGYDVWLGNSRGNKYSRRHVEFNPAQSRFWNYDWQEMGKYDLIANLDYIKK